MISWPNNVDCKKSVVVYKRESCANPYLTPWKWEGNWSGPEGLWSFLCTASMLSVSHVYKAFPVNMSCNAIARELCSQIWEPLLSSWMTRCCHCCNHFACKICNANRLADTVISRPSLIQGNGACGSARHLDSREHRENEWKEVLRITDFFQHWFPCFWWLGLECMRWNV